MDKKYIQWVIAGAISVSLALTIGYVVLICFIVNHNGPFEEFQRHILDTANGALVGALSSGVVGFWLGSSIGSLLKNPRPGEQQP